MNLYGTRIEFLLDEEPRITIPRDVTLRELHEIVAHLERGALVKYDEHSLQFGFQEEAEEMRFNEGYAEGYEDGRRELWEAILNISKGATTFVIQQMREELG